MSVDVLFVRLLSVTPLGGLTVAVLTRFPVAEARAVPVTLNTTELPAPAGTLIVAARLLPEPVPPLLTLAPPTMLEVQVTPVSVAGIVSATVAPTALLGPLLVTVIV